MGQKGKTANKRGEASSRGLDCPGERVLNILGGIWSTSASLSIHFPAPPSRPHPFTDYTSITPDNTWLPLNAMYRMTERCALPFFDISVRVYSGLVMKKKKREDWTTKGWEGEEEGEHRVVKTGLIGTRYPIGGWSRCSLSGKMLVRTRRFAIFERLRNNHPALIKRTEEQSKFFPHITVHEKHRKPWLPSLKDKSRFSFSVVLLKLKNIYFAFSLSRNFSLPSFFSIFSL